MTTTKEISLTCSISFVPQGGEKVIGVKVKVFGRRLLVKGEESFRRIPLTREPFLSIHGDGVVDGRVHGNRVTLKRLWSTPLNLGNNS